MSRPTLEVELGGPGSLIRGHGSREMYEEVVGRPPVWVSRLRGWSCQETTARDVIALAETRNYDVVITGRRSRRQQLLDVLMAAPLPLPPGNDESVSSELSTSVGSSATGQRVGQFHPTVHDREQLTLGEGSW